MRHLILFVFLIIPMLSMAVRDSSDVVVRLEFATMYSFGMPQSIGLTPKVMVQSKKDEFGMGLVFQQKVFPNPEIVRPNENSSFVSGLYGFYNHRINESETNAFCLQYNLLFQQSMVFRLNEVNYWETARMINVLDQNIGYTFRKRIQKRFYFRHSAGVGVVTYLSGAQDNQSPVRFGSSKFGLSGMVDVGIAYDIR